MSALEVCSFFASSCSYANQAQDSESQVFALIRSQKTAGPLSELAKASANVHIVETDTSDPKKLAETATAVGKVTGDKLDVLIYNAVNGGTEAQAYPPSKL